MLKTIAKEQHEVTAGKILTSKLFIDITDVLFSVNTDRITAYVQKGYFVENTEIQEDFVEGVIVENEIVTEHKKVTAVKKITYSQLEIKSLLDANNIVLNGSGENMLTDELATATILVAQYLVTADPNNNFGLTIDKWEVV